MYEKKIFILFKINLYDNNPKHLTHYYLIKIHLRHNKLTNLPHYNYDWTKHNVKENFLEPKKKLKKIFLHYIY